MSFRLSIFAFALFMPFSAFTLSAHAVLPDGTPANPVEAAYLEAKDHVNSLPSGSVEAAIAWEDFAKKEAHENSTVTGLQGQKSGEPNYAPSEAWAWNNAGYTYWLAGQGSDAVRCLKLALADPKISSECREKATKNLEAAESKAPSHPKSKSKSKAGK